MKALIVLFVSSIVLLLFLIDSAEGCQEMRAADCSLNGQCERGRCYCDSGFKGERCEFKQCLGRSSCSGHGVCKSNPNGDDGCICDQNWAGEACDQFLGCIDRYTTCSSHGDCSGSNCVCDSGWSGQHCENKIPDCSSTADCNYNGNCFNTVCLCYDGWTGKFCQTSTAPTSPPPTSPPPTSFSGCIRRSDCSNHGNCVNGDCQCDSGFTGMNCRELSGCISRDDCSSQGDCINGECQCDSGYSGDKCEEFEGCVTRNDCSSHGDCLNGECQCDSGYSGITCSAASAPSCPNGCSGNGVCSGSVCTCNPGFSGSACDTKDFSCKTESDCSNHGSCFMGQCSCQPGYGGEACQNQVCIEAKDCNNHGDCVDGKCQCHDGFDGALCQKGDYVHWCTNNDLCNGNGKCNSDATGCICNPGYTDRTCNRDIESPMLCIYSCQKPQPYYYNWCITGADKMSCTYRAQGMTCFDNTDFLNFTQQVDMNSMEQCEPYSCIGAGSQGLPYPQFSGESQRILPTCLRSFQSEVQVENFLSSIPKHLNNALQDSIVLETLNTNFQKIKKTYIHEEVSHLETPTLMEDGSKVYKKNFVFIHPTTKKFVRVNYHVEHESHINVWNLDHDGNVFNVTCTTDSMEITLLESSDSLLAVKKLKGKHMKHFIAGSPAWNCQGHKKKGFQSQSILRSVTEVQTIQVFGQHKSRFIKLKILTGFATYHNVFKHAKIDVTNTFIPDDHVKHYIADTSNCDPEQGCKLLKYADEDVQVHHLNSNEHQRHKIVKLGLLSFFSNIAKSVWHGVTSLAKNVENVVANIGKTVETIATGDLDYNKDMNLAEVTFNPSRGNIALLHGSDGFALCNGCQFHLDAGFHFDIEVASYSLHQSQGYIFGDAEYSISLGFQSYAEVHWETERILLGSLSFPAICALIGPVPVCFSLTVPIEAYLEVGASFGMEKSFTSSASGHIKQGFIYTSSDGFHTIDEKKFDASSTNPMEQTYLDLTVAAALHIVPTLHVDIDHIGYFYAGLNGILDTSLQVSTTSSPCGNYAGGGLKFLIQFGLQCVIGAGFDIHLGSVHVYQKEYEPKTLFSAKYPIVSACKYFAHPYSLKTLEMVRSEVVGRELVLFDELPSQEISQVPKIDLVFQGRVEHVSDNPSCIGFGDIELSIQFFYSDDTPFAVGSTNHFYTSKSGGYEYNINCIKQETFEIVYQCESMSDGTKKCFNSLVPNEIIGYNATSSNCTEPTVAPDQFFGIVTFLEDYNALAVESYSACIPTLILKRWQCTSDASCNNGKCSADGFCQCSDGWSGAVCDDKGVCETSSGICSGHGTCRGGLCQCDYGYRGSQCESTSCRSSIECGSPNGKCVNGDCICKDGFSGTHCATSTSTSTCTDRSSCSNHGNCISGSCQCDSGYSGQQCSESSQLCRNRASCSNHGNCVNGMCQCDSGYSGSSCLNAAIQCRNRSMCSNHGNCINGVCQCDSGFSGISCADSSD